MMNLAARSTQKELLDQDNIPFEDIKRNMQELNTINNLLGGHKISIDAFSKLAGGRKEVTVCEIGCGGGDNLAVIHQYASKKKIRVSLVGIDIKQECIEFARSSGKLPASTKFIVSDYSKVDFEEKPDILFSSLFCHHFTNDQLVQQLQWMQENSTIGFFINDLQRHFLAYHSIRILTRLFSSSYLVKHDAPLSVARSFTKNNWNDLLHDAGITSAAINWKWAFRYLVMYKHDQ